MESILFLSLCLVADPLNCYFTLRIHHGGSFINKMYVGGKIDSYDFCNVDLMSLLEIHDMVRSLGHKDDITFFVYQIYDGKWIEIDSDKEVMGMCNRLPSNMVCTIYIDHCGAECLVQSQPPEVDEVNEAADGVDVTADEVVNVGVNGGVNVASTDKETEEVLS